MRTKTAIALVMWGLAMGVLVGCAASADAPMDDEVGDSSGASDDGGDSSNPFADSSSGGDSSDSSSGSSSGSAGGSTDSSSDGSSGGSAGGGTDDASGGTDDSTSDTSGSSGGGAAPNCSELTLPENFDDVIATFEEGTGAVNHADGRGGGFYMYNDGTGTQEPAPGALPDATGVDRCGSMFALCMSGSGFTEWGAGMGTDVGPLLDMETGEKDSYDASEYSGIAFWAKINGGSTPIVRVNLKDGNTAPEGGVCDPEVPSGPMACNDDWGKTLNLTTDWQPYTITFDELRQSGWGASYPAFDPTTLYSIQWQVSQGLEFDVCIDDLVFVR